MEDGRWKMEDGRGKWKMGDGKWKMENPFPYEMLVGYFYNIMIDKNPKTSV